MSAWAECVFYFALSSSEIVIAVWIERSRVLGVYLDTLDGYLAVGSQIQYLKP